MWNMRASRSDHLQEVRTKNACRHGSQVGLAETSVPAEENMSDWEGGKSDPPPPSSI